jgi:hypothetical protein
LFLAMQSVASDRGTNFDRNPRAPRSRVLLLDAVHLLEKYYLLRAHRSDSDAGRLPAPSSATGSLTFSSRRKIKLVSGCACAPNSPIKRFARQVELLHQDILESRLGLHLIRCRVVRYAANVFPTSEVDRRAQSSARRAALPPPRRRRQRGTR